MGIVAINVVLMRAVKIEVFTLYFFLLVSNRIPRWGFVQLFVGETSF